jgi:hypothetical protein
LPVKPDVRDRFGLANILAGIAGLAEVSGQSQRARQLLGATAGLRAQGGYPLSASDHAWPDASLSTTTGRLAAELPSRDWDESRTWPYDRAVLEAARALQR